MHVSLEMGDSTVQQSPSSSSSSTSPTLSPSPPPPHFQAQNMPTFGPISSTELAHEMVSNFVNILIVDVQDDITGPKIVGAVRRRWIRSLVERLSVQDLNRLAAKHGFLPDIISHTSGNHRNGAILFDSTAEAAENSQAVDHAWLNWTGIKSSVSGDQIDYELDLDEEDFDEDDLELSFDSDECNSSCSCGADVDSATDGENKQAPMSYAAAVKGNTNFSSDNADTPTTSKTTSGEESTLIFSSTPAVPDSSSNSVAAPTNSDNQHQTHHRHHHHQLNHSSQAFFRSRTTQLRTSLLMKLQADERVLHSDLVIFYDDHGENEGYAARLARILSLDGLFNARYLTGGIEEFKKMAGWLCEGMPFPSVSQVVSSMDEDSMDTKEGNENDVDSMGEIEKLREFQSSLVQSVWYSFRAPQKDVPRCVLDPFLWLGGQDAA
ncbi:hypothetical protein BKA69DRAFT_780039 [Paraphysoderma sedebokerense]|nr:hypothetical protein BKA69DRAFT_780039 [Paraphysoderma sedebokerense]